MDLVIGQARVRLTDADLIGEGGEARVFRHGERAVKIFHPPTTPAQVKALELKLAKLERFPRGLPPCVLGLRELVHDRKGQRVGFTMPLVTDAVDASQLSQRRFREPHVPNEQVGRLMRSLSRALEVLHAQVVVVGDLNDGNVLVRPASDELFLIDADSMQFGGLPCAVAHERFLDPRLYGVELMSGPTFDAGTDWYAFAVMLFSSWLYVHPFGGTHPSLGTLLRRAEARHSVLRGDVTLPRVASSWKTLSDEALDYFSKTFEGSLRAPPPSGVLETPWTRCACGVVFARAVCPSCHALGPLATRPLVRTKGRCTAKTIFHTDGRVLAAASHGAVRYCFEHDGVVRREDGAVVLPRSLLAQERVHLAGPSTWLADARGGLTRLEGGLVKERAQTGLRGSEPVFACAAGVAYRTEREWVIEQNSSSRVGQILEGQTWLWTGERLGLGLYRAGGVSVAFLLRAHRPGLKQLDGFQLSGRLVSADAVFDAGHALLSVTLEAGGRDHVQRWLWSADGALLGLGEGRAGHAAVLGGRVIVGTDDGLIALGVDGGRLVEKVAFPDTQPFVSAQDALLPLSDGSLVVVTSKELVSLSLS